MKQNLWIALGAVTLTTLSITASSTQARQDLDQDPPSAPQSLPLVSQQSKPVSSSLLAQTPPNDTVKVGSRQSLSTIDDGIAKIQSHEWLGKQAATLYVRNLPVLTFLGSPTESVTTVKTGKVEQKIAVEIESEPDPVERASQVATVLNQLHQNRAKADTIKVVWSGGKKVQGAGQDRYTITSNNRTLVVMDQSVILAGQKQLKDEHPLQVTNRLRRLMGNAKPLTTVAGKPRPQPQQIALGSVRLTRNGHASWYGPGFHGNLSANGETFNQHALTAAHRDLPFGTRVRVTNLNNGRTVVVRINDRGPYIYDRDIDVSMGAAEVLGFVGGGVAPVRMDILN
jgi:rare lipoprotein A